MLLGRDPLKMGIQHQYVISDQCGRQSADYYLHHIGAPCRLRTVQPWPVGTIRNLAVCSDPLTCPFDCDTVEIDLNT
jgi:hypothetical protein